MASTAILERLLQRTSARYARNTRAPIASVFLFACAACVSAAGLDLPEETRDRSAAILGIEHADALTVYALAPGDVASLAALTVDEDARLTLFLYDQPLDRLGIPPGVVLPASRELGRRAIPAAETIRVRTAKQTEWLDGVPSAALEEFRFDGFSDEDCVETAGCYRDCSWPCVHEPCPEDQCTFGGDCPKQCYQPQPPVPPSPPSSPQTPDLPFSTSTCPPRWTPRAIPNFATPEAEVCRPPEAITCPQGRVLAGDFDCFDPSPSCTGTYAMPTDPMANTIYVGNGELYPTIEAALQIAQPNDAILLAPGDHAVDATIPIPLELRGSCARDTRLIATNTLRIEAPGVALRDVTITGAAIEVRANGELTIDRAVIAGALEIAGFIHAREVSIQGALNGSEGARLNFERSAIEGGDCVRLIGAGATFRAFRASRCSTSGIEAAEASTATAEALIIEDTAISAISVIQNSTFALRDVFIRTVRGDGDAQGQAIHAYSSSISVARAVFEDLPRRGVLIFSSTVSISDVVVHAFTEDVAPDMIPGALTLIGSTSNLSRISLSGGLAGGVAIEGGTATIIDTIMLGRPSIGAALSAGGTSAVEVSRFAGAGHFRGLLLVRGATANVSDLALRESKMTPMMRSAAILIGEGILELDRAELADNDGDGIYVNTGQRLIARDLLISDSGDNGLFATSASVALTRARIVRSGLAGLIVENADSFLDATDVDIERADAALSFEHGATGKLVRARLADFTSTGLLLDELPPAPLDANDVTIEGANDSSRCEERGAVGVVLEAEDIGLNLTLNRFRIVKTFVGIDLRFLARTELTDGFLEQNVNALRVRRMHERRHLFDTLFFGDQNCRALVWSN